MGEVGSTLCTFGVRNSDASFDINKYGQMVTEIWEYQVGPLVHVSCCGPLRAYNPISLPFSPLKALHL